MMNEHKNTTQSPPLEASDRNEFSSKRASSSTAAAGVKWKYLAERSDIGPDVANKVWEMLAPPKLVQLPFRDELHEVVAHMRGPGHSIAWCVEYVKLGDAAYLERLFQRQLTRARARPIDPNYVPVDITDFTDDDEE